MEPAPLALEGEALTTRPLRKSGSLAPRQSQKIMRAQLWLGGGSDVFRHLAGLRALHHCTWWSTHHSHSCWCLCHSTWVSPSEHQPLTRLPSIKYHWKGISDRSKANSILLPEWQTRLSGQAVSWQKAVVRSSSLPRPRKPPILHWQAVWCWASHFPSASLRVCTWEMQILLVHLIVLFWKIIVIWVQTTYTECGTQ